MMSEDPLDRADERPDVAPPATVPLHRLRPGDAAVIARVGGDGALRRRLVEMGIVRGAPIAVRKVAPLGDPILYAVKGYLLSLRAVEAALIEVTPLAAGGAQGGPPHG